MEALIYHGRGERIDAWLSKQFSYSRNFFQHIIERGGITVISAKSDTHLAIGLKVKKSYKLQEGDLIHIDHLERFLDGGILAECPPLALDIRHETKDYLVIYKPKGILSHPNSVWDVHSPSIVGGLYHHFYKHLPSGGSFIRAGLVHRLDKETDGLMIVAKTEQGLEYFKTLFQQKSLAPTIQAKEQIPLKKRYRALCIPTPVGDIFVKEIEQQLPYIIQEDVIPRTPHPVIKEGITKILAIEPEGEYLLLDIEILTGRTHQIRYHLSHHGLPIVGDYVYGKESDAGMQLTAWKLSFQDPAGHDIVISL